MRGIQDGNWDTDTDCMNSMNEGLCWDTGDTIGWGKVPRESQNFGTLNPYLMEGFSMPWFTNRTAGTACQALPYRGCRAPAPQAMASLILPPHSSALPGLRSTGLTDLPQTPTLQAHMISTGPTPFRPARLAIHRHEQSLWAVTLSPVKLVIHRHTWSPPGCAPQACIGMHYLCQTTPSGLPSRWSTGLHDHHNLSTKASQEHYPQAHMISTLPGPHPSGTPAR
jgi:hypothetical protein